MHRSDSIRMWLSWLNTRTILIGLGIVATILIGRTVSRASAGYDSLVYVIAPFVALLILIRPELGVYLTAALIPIENVIMFGEEITAVRMLGMFVAGIWVAQKVLRRESWQPVFSSILIKTVLPLLLLIGISASWAAEPNETYSGLSQLFRMLLWGVMVADMTASWKQMDRLAKALVLGAILGSTLVVEQYFMGGVKRAGSDIAGGINGTAATMVTIMPFAFYLIRSQQNRFWRFVGLVYAVVGLIAVTVSFSRTSYLLLGLVVIASYWDVFRKRERSIGSFIVIIIAVILAALYLLPKDAISYRIETMDDYTLATFATGEAETSSRGFHWRVGVAMFKDHPVLGVGFGNFPYYWQFYRYTVPGTSVLYGSRRTSHNSYITFLAELGIWGLALWLLVLLLPLRGLLKSLIKWAGDTSSTQFLLTQAVMFGMLLEVGYGWAINIQHEKLLWLFLGMSITIQALSFIPKTSTVLGNKHISRQMPSHDTI